MQKQRLYFGFRFENGMKKRIKWQLERRGGGLNSFVEDALRFIANLHDRGKLRFLWLSNFLTRTDKEDRFETMLILQPDVHEMVRNYAFSYRRSMAEVLRVALEVYLEYLESSDGKLVDTMHYYDKPVPVINTATARLIPAFHHGIPPNQYNIFTYSHLTAK